MGARSKPPHQAGGGELRHTTEPRWGRDQNCIVDQTHEMACIPQSPGGGEIKTAFQRRLQGGLPYHRAPVGARSKRGGGVASGAGSHTTEPRWGRDQNHNLGTFYYMSHIPQSPGGGEIKTPNNYARPTLQPYHRAPVGARSKPYCFFEFFGNAHTTEPRWGRDQNEISKDSGISELIPQSPGGGEIKTRRLSGWIGGLHTTEPRWGRDQNYKRCRALVDFQHTTEPRWGRDQN